MRGTLSDGPLIVNLKIVIMISKEQQRKLKMATRPSELAILVPYRNRESYLNIKLS